jgi:hypothetical protein
MTDSLNIQDILIVLLYINIANTKTTLRFLVYEVTENSQKFAKREDVVASWSLDMGSPILHYRLCSLETM